MPIQGKAERPRPKGEGGGEREIKQFMASLGLGLSQPMSHGIYTYLRYFLEK